MNKMVKEHRNKVVVVVGWPSFENLEGLNYLHSGTLYIQDSIAGKESTEATFVAEGCMFYRIRTSTVIAIIKKGSKIFPAL